MPSVPSAVPASRARLLAGAAALAVLLGAGPALAQAEAQTQGGTEVQTPTAQPRSSAQARGPAGPDGLRPDGLYLEADSITEDEATDTITATGSVQARYEGRLLRADRVDYQTETGLLAAQGNAELVNPDGTVQYADTIELDDELRAGVATGFAARMEDNVKIAAATAVRRSETVNELHRAIFTPCDICNSEGEPAEPTWSIQADRVVQDQDNNVVFYRNAVLRVAGVPVLYSPVFWHPDPTAERASGLLMPTLSASDGRGLSYEQPYLWAISPSQDLIVSPQINQRVNPFLNLGWRKRFWSGVIEARGGYTYERLFGDVDLNRDGVIVDSEENARYGDATSQSYILAEGRFRVGRDWRWGFTAERVSDKTLFDRYDIEDVYEDRGLYLADYRRLISQAYAERQTRRSYFSVAAFAFQSLRIRGFDSTPDFLPPGLPLPRNDVRGVLFEDDGAFPIVAPLIEVRWEPSGPVLGGRLRLRGSAVALTRDDYVGAPVLSPDYLVSGPTDGLPGVDSRRASAELDWRRVITTRGGLRLESFAVARGDVYSISELTPGAEDETVARAHATLGLDVRYPLIRRFAGGSSLTLEPMAQIALSPDADIDPRVPNEDSQYLELDETTLFQENKFPGYDLYEGGARLSLGGRARYEWDTGRYASLFVGRMFRADAEEGYLQPVAGTPGETFDPTGISESASDWVVAATFSPFARASGWGRAQLDGDSLEVRRAEAGVSARFRENDRVALRYIVDRSEISSGATQTNYEYLQASGQVFLVGDWGVTFRAVRDLDSDLWRRSEIGLLYEDECIRFEIIYERNETLQAQRGIRSSEGVSFRLTLATLGGSGYSDRDVR